MPHDDSGLADERTRLAWDRTALSYLGIGILLVRAGLEHRSLAGWLGATVALLAAIALMRGPRAYGAGPRTPGLTGPRACVTASVMIAALATVGVL